jgi:Cd2+/Zn2+-exporting ATPase
VKKELPLVSRTAEEASPYAEDQQGLTRSVVRIEGMDCASCAVTVEKSVGRVPGVRRAVVNFAAGRLDAYHETGVSVEELKRAVEGAGYTVRRGREAGSTSFWRAPRTLLLIVALMLLILGGVLQAAGAPGLLNVGAYATAGVIGGVQIFRAALVALRARRMDMNVLMSAAAIGAAGIGAWGEAALVIVLFSAGNALQGYAVDRTRNAVRALASLTPDEALVIRDGGEQLLLPVEEVLVGDVVVVRPGERLAVDGEVVEGSSTVDESPVTGESVPVEKGAGDLILSGSLNGDGGLLVRATRPAAESTIQNVARLVEEAQATRAPTEQFVDRFSRTYTPVVVGVAAALATVPPLFVGEFGTWFYRALALLIIACPCSLVISTPVAVVSGIGAASRRGVLIKGGAALEAAGRLKVLLFDKTGTLTEGRPVLERVLPLGRVGKEEALTLAAALERRSEHPLAHAVLSAAGDLDLPEVENFRAVAGRGAEGIIHGKHYLVGSPRLFAERGVQLGPARDALEEVGKAGETPVVLGDDNGPLAVLGLADAVRDDAGGALEELREAGVEQIVMLTGDAEASADRVAKELGIGYRSRLLPDEKVEAVREMVARGRAVGVVGDGINDAPALAASSVGFAMGEAGTGVALQTADIALMRDDLGGISEAVRISRSAERIIKQNIFASILIKGVFVLLAPFGLVTLWLAVLADMCTSIAVTLNGLRLFR